MLTNVFSRMWTLPEADEVEVPNLRRGEEGERNTGDCNVHKVIYFLASFISRKYFQHFKFNLMHL